MAKKLKRQEDKYVTDYMNHDVGESVSIQAQWKGVVAHRVLTMELMRMRDIRDTFIKSGLDDAAERMQQQINDKELERKNLEIQLDAERREMSAALLCCLAACDVATSAADNFASVMHTVSKGIYGTDNDFARSVREQADSFNKIVQAVDEGGNYNLGMLYADIAEEVVDTVLPIIKNIITKWHNTAKGRRFF